MLHWEQALRLRGYFRSMSTSIMGTQHSHYRSARCCQHGVAGGALGLDVDRHAHHELPHDDAKAVDVAALVEPLVLRHLWRQEERRACTMEGTSTTPEAWACRRADCIRFSVACCLLRQSTTTYAAWDSGQQHGQGQLLLIML